MKPKASVIIPTYNREAELERVLSALERQEGQHAFEVLVVDDGSTDGTRSVLSKQRRFTLTPLRQDNAGPGAVNGRVPRNGETEYYVPKVLAAWAHTRPPPPPQARAKPKPPAPARAKPPAPASKAPPKPAVAADARRG